MQLPMNKILIFLLLISSPLFAQIEKGNSYIWGTASANNLNFSSGSVYTNNRFSPNLNLSYGKFIKDGLMIGASIGLTGSIERIKTTLPNNSSTSSNDNLTSQIGLFARQYFKAIPRLYPYAGAGLRFSTSQNTIDDKRISSGWAVLPQFQLGFNYLVSPRISVVLGTTSSVFPIGFYGLEMGLNYSLKSQKLNSKVLAIEQTNTRNWLLGAGLFFSGNSTNRSMQVASSYSSGLNVSVGRFVGNGLLVGLGIGVSTNNYISETPKLETNSLIISFQPFIKKYLSRNRQLSPYWSAGLSYEQQMTKNNNGSSTDIKNNIYGFDGGMGLAYFIGNNLILEAGLANVSYRSLAFDGNKSNSVGGGFTFSPNFTLNYVLKSQPKQ